MNEEKKNEVIANAESVEAIRDFLSEWWSVSDLYESAAKASRELVYGISKGFISKDDAKEMSEMLEQHMMMIELLKPFERKDGEV